MHYIANAYLGTNTTVPMEHLGTSDFSAVLDFVWRNCKRGNNCVIADNETGMTWYAYADDITDDVVEPGELFRSTRRE